MEHVIGDFFVLDMIVYQCREGDSCVGCSCYYKEENVCTDYLSTMGYCGSVIRRDGKDVIFVQVGDVDSPLVITSDMLKR